jgi:adenylyltransferase/sulfurtransferase
VKVVTHQTKLTSDNAEDLLRTYDVAVDGTDNYTARYDLNDACVSLGIPAVYGAVFRFEGQISVFDPSRGPCYRCLYPEPPPPESAPSCADAGVIGIVPGVIGTLQATEVIKLVLSIGRPLVGRLLVFDALAPGFQELRVYKDPTCGSCGSVSTS